MAFQPMGSPGRNPAILARTAFAPSSMNDTCHY